MENINELKRVSKLSLKRKTTGMKKDERNEKREIRKN
jgi:hypothetical protein